MPERALVSINRHVDRSGTDAFFQDAFSRLRAAAPGVRGIAGVPFVIFYGEVSDDSDGPIELCRPIERDPAPNRPGGRPISNAASSPPTRKPTSVSR